MKSSGRVRMAGICVAILVTALTPMAVTVPAAATATATVVISTGLVVTPTTVNLVAGDTIQFQNGANALSVVNGTGQLRSLTAVNCVSASTSSAGASCPVGDSLTSSFTVMRTGTVVLYRYTPSATIVSTITIGSGGSGGGGGGSDAESADTTPVPVIQQVGMPTGGCSGVDDVRLNWAGIASGGWGQSWAQWPNSGNGGAVCSRMLTYRTELGRWIVS